MIKPSNHWDIGDTMGCKLDIASGEIEGGCEEHNRTKQTELFLAAKIYQKWWFIEYQLVHQLSSTNYYIIFRVPYLTKIVLYFQLVMFDNHRVNENGNMDY